MFKNMDNSFIKSMMQMQGMNISDEQLNMMKNNLNPQLMKMAANTNTNNIPVQIPSYTNTQNSNLNYSNNNLNTEPNTNSNITSSNSNITSSNSNVNNYSSPSAGFPDLGNMDMSKMMEFIQKNPQMMNMMGSQMSGMFGGGGGANGANGNPNIDPNLMMNSIQTILWLMSIPSKIKQFFYSTQGKLFILLLVFLLGYYLKR
jgi:hypothetical protein